MTYNEIKSIGIEIQRLKSKLGRLESEAYNVSPKLGDAPRGGGSGDKIGNVVAEITDIKCEIQALETKRSTALNMLNCEKCIENCLYMRLRQNYSWPKIAAKIGTTPDCIRMACERYSW